MLTFTLNGQVVSVNDTPDTPLLWVVRDTFKLKGSKFGCGVGLCGACTMHVDGKAVRTCALPLSAVAGKSVTTIEGLGTPEHPHFVQRVWASQSVPQCGYCQSGQIMSATALLNTNPSPTEAEVEQALAGNICRCGCYVRIKKAILDASKLTAVPSPTTPITESPPLFHELSREEVSAS